MNARSRLVLLTALALVAACAWSQPARAQTANAARPSAAPRVHLSWVRDAEAAEACPDANGVQADVAGRLGFSPFVAGGPDSASIEVLVTHVKSQWQAAVVMRAADGTLRGNRHVESAAADCRSLASAAALAIALMIDPELLLRPPPAAVVAPPPPVEPVAPVEPSPAATAPAAAPPRRGPSGAVGLGVVAASGLLPDPALGPSLRAELGLHERLGLLVSAQYLSQHTERAGAAAWLGLTLASAGPCYRVELGEHWAVASCGAFWLGSLSVAIESPEPVQAKPRAWLGASCGLGVSLRVGAFELSLRGDALAHFARHNYTVSRQQPLRTESLFTEPAAVALGSLSAGVRF